MLRLNDDESKAEGEKWSFAGYFLKIKPTKFANRLDIGYKIGKSRITPKFLNWASRRIASPTTKMIETVGGGEVEEIKGAQFWTGQLDMSSRLLNKFNFRTGVCPKYKRDNF